MSVTGRTYSKTRPRGFVDWTPRADTARLIEQVRHVLTVYRDQLPLSLRQVFYVLVGQHGYDKTEQAYKRLGEHVNRARRAGLIDMSAIRDDGLTADGPGGYYDADNFRSAVMGSATHYRRHLGVHQPDRVELWVEAAGMVPQAAQVAHRYGVTVYSSGGFDSTTAKHSAAQRLADDARQAVILHVGDYDPSGCAIIDSAAEDVSAFTVGMGAPDPVFERVAVTPEQIRDYRLPTAPQKNTDRRGEHMAGTVQAEALPPDVLAQVIDAAVRDRVDLDVLAETRAEADRERAQLLDELSGLGWSE